MLDEKEVTCEKDLKIALDLWEKIKLEKKFTVANPVSGLKGSDESNNWHTAVRKAIAQIDPNLPSFKQELLVSKVPADIRFYRKLGHVIEKKSETMKRVDLKCLDFNAYLSRKLKKMGFKGTIHKGLIGHSTTSGHEFLVLYAGDGGRERIFDCWSALQTGKEPICKSGEYADLLPKGTLQEALKKSGIKVSTDLTHTVNI